MVIRRKNAPKSQRAALAFAALLLLASCTKHGDKASLPSEHSSAGSTEASGQSALPNQGTTPAANDAAANPSSGAPKADQAAVGTQAAVSTQANQATPLASPSVPPTVDETRLSGEITSVRKSLLAFKSPGYIEKILVRPGDHVKKGQLLAVLDKRDYELRLKQAVIQRDQAKVNLDTAKKDYDREKELQDQKASTQMSWDKVSAEYEAGKLSAAAAEVQVQLAQKALDDASLVAPYDCVVSQQMKYVGEQVGQGGQGPVFEVYDLAQPEITLNAPEALLGKLKVGDRLSVSLPAVGYKGEARVTRLVPVVNETTRLFQVIARFANNDERVVPGYFAEAVVADK